MKRKLAIILLVISATACLGTGCSKSSDEITAKDSEPATTESAEANTIENTEDTTQYVILPEDYRAYKIQTVLEEVTDDAITEYINSNIIKGIPKTEACSSGDIVSIEYTITLKDSESEEESEEYEFTLGSGEILEDIEKNITGMKSGDNKEFDITYPDYMGEELAGKEAHISLTLKNVLSPTTFEEISEDQLTKITDEYSSKDTLWSSAKAYLANSNEEAYNEQVAKEIVDYLVSGSHMEGVDEKALDEFTKAYETSLDNVCKNNSDMTYKEYLNSTASMTDFEYEKQLQDDAYKAYKQLLVMNAVAGDNSIEITDEDMKQTVKSMYENYGANSEDDFISLFGQDTCKMYASQDKVIAFMKKICS